MRVMYVVKVSLAGSESIVQGTTCSSKCPNPRRRVLVLAASSSLLASISPTAHDRILRDQERATVWRELLLLPMTMLASSRGPLPPWQEGVAGDHEASEAIYNHAIACTVVKVLSPLMVALVCLAR